MLFGGAGGSFISEAKQFNKNGCDGSHQLYQFTRQKKQEGQEEKYEKLQKIAEKYYSKSLNNAIFRTKGNSYCSNHIANSYCQPKNGPGFF